MKISGLRFKKIKMILRIVVLQIILILQLTQSHLTVALKCYFCSGKDDCSSGVCEATTACWQQILPRSHGGYRVDKLCGNHEPTFFPYQGEGCHTIPSVYSEVVFCKCNSSDFCNNAVFFRRFPQFFETASHTGGQSQNHNHNHGGSESQESLDSAQNDHVSVTCYSCQKEDASDCQDQQCTGAWCLQETRRAASGRILSVYKNCSQVNEFTGEREHCEEQDTTTIQNEGAELGVIIQRCGCRSRDLCNAPRFLDTLPKRRINARSNFDDLSSKNSGVNCRRDNFINWIFYMLIMSMISCVFNG